MMPRIGKLRFNGAEWMLVGLPETPVRYGIWGAAPDALFGVGAAGTTMRFDGRSWKVDAPVTTQNLRGVWGTAANNVYIVGEGGTLLRYDGASYSAMPTSGSWASLESVWGTASNNVFAVGDGGTIIRWNGSTWSAMTSGTTADAAPSCATTDRSGLRWHREPSGPTCTRSGGRRPRPCG
jgi:photosystem II stability/assembly factor-like uncharacterized protein